MTLKLFNTLTGKKEIFKPRNGKRVNFFVCGPTVYDYSHIGHGRTYVAFDVIAKYLRFAGYRVFYLQNITDIDDKIINRARELKKNPLLLSREYAKAYRLDMKRLGVTAVTKYAPASKFIPEIIKQIKTLIKKKYAYETHGGIYFDITRFSSYGKLSHQSLQALRKAVRIEQDRNKRHDFDFVLWKAKKTGEPFWKSPWGDGRPGWHIEDTAISKHFFGPQYDIHCGAEDLKFPHHESEIAQQEAASGKTPFVKYWLHTGLLNIRGEKMSKSLKNFVTIREMLARHTPEAFRLLVLQNHYRSPLNYTDDSIGAAEEGAKRLGEFVERIKKVKNTIQNSKINDRLLNKFVLAMNNDFDTAKVIAELFQFMKTANAAMDAGAMPQKEAKTILKNFKIINSVLGIIPKPQKTNIPQTIQKMAEAREQFRKEKKWHEADAMREEIKKAGYLIEDTPSGVTMKPF
ncbi:cysteine--tRNA ligase [Patescibacteria group bacterium]|nr:cysteine--tRNA ligase [Patescibacteria group bacterium]